MLDSTKNSIKFRINNNYRNYLILNYYSSGLLKNSLPSQENIRKLEEIKETVISSTKEPIKNLSKITNKEVVIIDYIDPLKIIADFINTEFFFDSQKTMESILNIYETNMKGLIDDFQISPMDQMKLQKIKFIQ
tara:strand:- start:67 stop:468 length:402 start_codon:yes stop_codon:yes gene_type:complete